MSDTPRPSLAMRVVSESAKPLPRWVGIAGLVLVNIGTFGHDSLAKAFGGGRFGEIAANLIPVLGSALSTLAVAVNGKAGE